MSRMWESGIAGDDEVMTRNMPPTPSGPPFTPTRSASPQTTAGTRHSVIVLAVSIVAGLAAAAIPTWLVFQAVYTSAYEQCSSGKFCGLGAAIEGVLAAVPLGYLVYGIIGVVLIFRLRGRGHRSPLVVVHLLAPTALFGLLLATA